MNRVNDETDSMLKKSSNDCMKTSAIEKMENSEL